MGRQDRSRWVVAVGLVSVVLALTTACEISTDVAVNCSLSGGGTQAVRTNPVPERAAPGAPIAIDVTPEMFPVSDLLVGIDILDVTITVPLPTQLAAVDSVSLKGGNLAGTATVVARDVVVELTGPVPSDQVQLPTLVIRAHAPGAPTTIEWRSYRLLVAHAPFFIGTLTEECVPHVPDLVLDRTEVI